MQTTALAAVIEPVLAERELELDSLEVIPMGHRSVLRITVDGEGPKGRGPLLDDIAEASQAISRALDESNADGGSPYTLEVSSRGVSKPLTEAKHYRRNRGRLIKFQRGTEQLTGRILEAGDDEVTLDVTGRQMALAYADIDKAVVQVELNRPMNDDEE
ncbi:ribosome maturation factor RimP [Tessaracoccus caeni]|uniref:ribosome maturation factor RimP n=1 Tax=Tessaracoccus caeni TaxID=3031239 RepID=UPI0023DC716C|nr:ribosome maturation factor RimP [Tessaracoccus caeni]MDF1486751.1 ribosome maturation factor RimP [Tessaracoccus caeni]